MRSDDPLSEEQVAAFHEEITVYLREKDRGAALLRRGWILWLNVGAALVAATLALLDAARPPRVALSAAAVLVGGATAAAAAWLALEGRRWARSALIACVAVAVAAGVVGAVATLDRTGPIAPRPLLAPAKTGSDGCYIRPTGRVDCTL